MPTHVRKRGPVDRADPVSNVVQLGDFTDGPPGELGTWTATPGVSFDERPLEPGMCSSVKDFWDPAARRRVLWGWVRGYPYGAKTVPRVVTYHPVLKQLVYSPLDELSRLHRGPAPLAAVASIPLRDGIPHAVLADLDGAGKRTSTAI